ncbi:uncharacterized protein LOC114958937 [Acropora millepora]|uniref:uncharacterized protein LOC114958937 n=1 Tax=Acropora millepora TaxID=45264 RepID=UPI001CF51DEE|nr:uncharacterized protein LOC114958937 [Acropora millepora]
MAEEMSSGMADNSTKPKKQSRRKQGTERRGKTAGSTKEKIDEQQRLKELEPSIRFQVAEEERAYKIVKKLVLEDNISSDFLVQAMSESHRLRCLSQKYFFFSIVCQSIPAVPTPPPPG